MHRFWRSFLDQRFSVAGGAFVAALALTAIVIAIFPLGHPHAISANVLLSPSSKHPFGTDELGRDVLTEVIYGTQASLLVGFAAAAIATSLGILIGAASGYFGNWFDTIVMRITEIFQVLPTFIFAAMIVALSGPGMSRVVLVIALLAWPQAARVMRGEVMRVKQLEYVSVARCQGFDEWTILLRDVIPNSVTPVLAVATLMVGQAILLEAGLSFFGLTSADIISWGRMLYSGQRFLFNGWWLSVFPGLAILLTVLAFNLLGDGIQSALDPRSRK